MPIEKLVEFAKDGQKNTDDLSLTDGFSVIKKPARQWFNYLFNMFSLKINELIDLDPIARTEIIDNLTTDDATKPVSAKQAKNLQDNKLDANKRGAESGVASLDENKKVPTAELPTASVDNAGIVRLVNDLTTGGTDKALTAEQGKVLNDKMFGVGQTRTDVTASRALATTYTNTSPRPRQVYIRVLLAASSTAKLFEGTDEIFHINSPAPAGQVLTLYGIIQPGKTYSATQVLGTATIQYWGEL